MPERLLIQSIESEKGEWDLSFLQEKTLIESIHTDSPSLKLIIGDRLEVLQEMAGIQTGDEIKVSFSDPSESWMGNMNFIITKIKSLGDPQGSLKIEAIDKKLANLFKRDYYLFSQDSLRRIFKILVPEVSTQWIAETPVIQDYHLIHARKNVLCKQIAKEEGLCVFFQKERFVAQSIETLLKQDPVLTIEQNKPTADYPLLEFEWIRPEWIIQETTQFDYQGWEMEKGAINPEKKQTAPRKLAPFSSPVILQNMRVTYVPIVDFAIFGKLSLNAGDVIKIIWHSNWKDLGVQENKPEKIVIQQISHFSDNKRYLNRIIGCIPYVSK